MLLGLTVRELMSLMRTGGQLKILYFDIDGTLLCNSQPKIALANGAFERSVRDAGFDQLVCVGNIVTAIHFLDSIKEPMNGLKFSIDISLYVSQTSEGSGGEPDRKRIDPFC